MKEATWLLSQLTLIERKSILSTRFGGVYLPPNDLQRAAAQFCERPAYIANGDGRSISFSGSSSMLKYNGRFLCVCTKHQLRDVPIDSICLRTAIDSKFISANGYVFANPLNALPELHRHDLCFFDFSKAVESGDIPASRFYSLDAEDSTIRESDGISLVVLSGFPYKDDKIDYTLDEHSDAEFRLDSIHGKKRILICKLKSSQSDAETFVLDRVGDRVADPDGMSGGPAFALQSEYGGFSLRFSGIIISGGNEIMRVLRAKYVMSFIVSALEDER